MPVIFATFDEPEDITSPGYDGKIFRFPVTLVDRDDLGTPREPSKIKSARIKVDISQNVIRKWGLGQNDRKKVAFEFATERLSAALKSSAWEGGDLEVVVHTGTHKGACPFDPALIQEPADAVVEIEITRPIGFISGD